MRAFVFDLNTYLHSSCQRVFPILGIMKHAGQIISQKIKESGISISYVAKHLKVQRATLYNLFEREIWPAHRLRAIEALLHIDLSDLYPKEPLHKDNPFFLTPEQAQTLLKEREEFRRLYLEAMNQLNFYKANPHN